MKAKKLLLKKKDGKRVIHKEGEEEVVGATLAPADEPENDKGTKTKKAKGKKAKGKKVKTERITKPEGEAEPKQKVGVVAQGTVEVDGKITEQETFEREVSGKMANVGFGLARTINLGDYESLKVSITLHVPSEVSEDEIEGNYSFCKGWCEDKLDGVVSEYSSDIDFDDAPF